MRVLFLVSGFGEHIVLKNLFRKELRKDFELFVAGFQKDSTGVLLAKQHGARNVIFDYSENESVFADNLNGVVNELRPDIIFLLFDRILPPQFVEKCASPVINIHPSILPSFKGLKVVDKAIKYGVKFTGVTVHIVNAELDGGPIIMQSIIPVPQKTKSYTDLQEIFRKHFILMSTQVLYWYKENRINVSARTVEVKDAQFHPSVFYPNLEPHVISACGINNFYG